MLELTLLRLGLGLRLVLGLGHTIYKITYDSFTCVLVSVGLNHTKNERYKFENSV